MLYFSSKKIIKMNCNTDIKDIIVIEGVYSCYFVQTAFLCIFE